MTRASSGEPLKGIEVCAYTGESESFDCAQTKADGSYTITGLESGKYEVEFSAPYESGLNYIHQYWEYQSNLAQATQIDVKAPEIVAGIDAKLQEGGKIQGKVTDASTGAALSGAVVCTVAEQGIGECAITNANGEYVIQSLTSGNYKIFFSAEKGYLTQYYDEKPSSKEAQTVAVTAPNTTSGINAAMQPVTSPPANSAPPSISGTTTVGSTLLCAPGRWTGKPAPTYGYQWQRDGSAISAANDSSYVVQSVDAGSNLSCQVTAKNSAGEKSATSASVAIPVAPPQTTPVPVVTITGSKLTIVGKSAAIRIKCAAAAPCVGSAQLSFQVATKHRHGTKLILRKENLILARGSYSLQAGKSGKLLLRLTATGRRRLAHVRHHRVTARLLLSVEGGKMVTKAVLVS